MLRNFDFALGCVIFLREKTKIKIKKNEKIEKIEKNQNSQTNNKIEETKQNVVYKKKNLRFFKSPICLNENSLIISYVFVYHFRSW